MSLLQLILLAWVVGLFYFAVRMRLFKRPLAGTAANEQSLLRRLLRLYCYGWFAILPLIVLWAIVIWASFDRSLVDFWLGLEMGTINLGLLWTGLFLVIAAASGVACWLRR